MKKAFSLFCLLSSAVFCQEIKPMDFNHIKEKMPKINPQLIDIHLKLYKGYVKQVNYIDAQLLTAKNSFLLQSLRKQYGFEYDGMRLHELYFGQLGGNGKMAKNKRLIKKIIDKYGSTECFKKEVHSFAKTRGIGWIILFGELETDEIKLSWIGDHEKGFLSGWFPIFVIDLWEHAYISQFGLNKQKYIDLMFEYTDWTIVNSRYIKNCTTAKYEYKKLNK